VLIINQGQSENVQLVIDQYQPGNPPIQHYCQARKGLSAARNLASALASFPIIAFTDDDCVPNPDWIYWIDHTFHSFSAVDGVTGRILPLGPESPDQFEVSVRTSQKAAEFRGRALPWSVGSGGNFAVKREWLSRVGYYDEGLGAGAAGKAGEDMDLFYRLLRSGAVIRYEPEVVIYHERQDRTRLTQSFWNYAYGIGAFSAKFLRKGDLYTGYILGAWLFWLFWQMGSAIIHRDNVQAGGSLLKLRGCLHGLAYGLKFG